MNEYWKKCSSCKTPIPYNTHYFVCSVSTCQHPRKGFQFCSVPCWDAHLGYVSHRDSWAVEMTSPAKPEGIETVENPSAHEQGRAPRRKIVSPLPKAIDSTPESVRTSAAAISSETLVVVSKVKKLIKDQSGFNTSQCCIDALTDKIVEECLAAIDRAREAERKTVMGRDVALRR